MGFGGTYSGLMPMGRGGNVHSQQAPGGTSVRPGSAGSAPTAGFADQYNFVSCVDNVKQISEINNSDHYTCTHICFMNAFRILLMISG